MLFWWLYDVLIAPACVVFTIICVAVKNISLHEEPRKNIDESLKELKGESSWAHGRIVKLLDANDAIIRHAEQLEAKIKVITSVLSLTRNEVQPTAKNNPLEDC